MGVALGLFFGIGLLLVIMSFVVPPTEKPKVDGRLTRGSRELLAGAGVEAVSPQAFIGMCVLAGALGAVLMFGVSGVVPVGLVFGVMAAGAPVAILKGRAGPGDGTPSSMSCGPTWSTTWPPRCGPACRELIETGAKREVAMMVPVVFLVLPVTVVFAFYPGVIGIQLVAG